MAQQTDSFEFKDENARFGIKDEWMNKPLHIGGQKQQTAVEWLANELHVFIHPEHGKDFLPILKQAKAMEKEQIVNAHGKKINGGFRTNGDFFQEEITGEQYYNEIYGK